MERLNNHVDSSSEDEIPTSVLKEIVDEDCLYNNLYSTKKDNLVPQDESSNLRKQSLRVRSNQESQFTNFGVTSETQTFVARKLHDRLERTIKLSKKVVERGAKRKRKKSGIKLLSTSGTVLTATEVAEIPAEWKIKSKKHEKHQEASDDDNDLAKFREIAVDAEFVLSQSETKAWSNKRPEPEFKYKRLKDGTLEEVA